MAEAAPVTLSEPFCVQDIPVEGLWSIERIGWGQLRFIFYMTMQGHPTHVASLVAHRDAVPPAIVKCTREVGFSFLRHLPMIGGRPH